MMSLILLLCIALGGVAESKICPDIMVWDACGSSCPPTCRNPYPICIAVCKARCECPDYAPILHDGECIPLEKCPGRTCVAKQCVNTCPEGYRTDADGCQTCDCQDRIHVGEVKPQGNAELLRCPQIECLNYCPNGYQRDLDGCLLCECEADDFMNDDPCENVECKEDFVCKVFPLTVTRHRLARCIDPTWPAPCQFPMDSGRCKAFKSMWYFDQDNQQCLQFDYGGCEGNWNKFESREKCEKICLAEPPIVCPALDCHLQCEHGLAKHEKTSCYICQCGDKDGKSIEEKCPNPMAECMIDCEFGFKKNINDCPVCECQSESACPEIACMMECPYGFTRDANNCPLCVCADSPCDFYDCPEEKHCHPAQFKPGRWKPECVDPEESRLWCENTPMCQMECEHGFVQNSIGCPLCECLHSMATCSLEECTDTCDYGHRYDRNGCRTCDCLPDPCQMIECGEEQACEHTALCPMCPHATACIDGTDAQRISVNLNFSHGIFQPEEFNKQEFITEFESRVSRIMGIDEEYIRDVKLRFEDDGHIRLRFHVLTFGEIDVVHAYKLFQEKVSLHEPGTAVNIAGIDFVPEHESLQVEYSSQASYTDPENFENDIIDEEEEGDMTMTVIMVACACGAAVFFIVLIVLVVTLKKAKVKQAKKQQQRPTSSVRYSKAPASDPAQTSVKHSRQSVKDNETTRAEV